METKPEDYKGVSITKLFASDKDGFKYVVTYDKIMRDGRGFINRGKFHKSNPFSIDNINNCFKIWDVPFVCISKEYISNSSDLEFKCLRCGEIIVKTWRNVNRSRCNNDSGFRHIACPNCDRRYESLHASILKQMFLHEHPDTIVEDCSFVSKTTCRSRPTDIVNHRMKIAIEIQSQWHDFDDAIIKDAEKKRYWEDKGYKFYSPDIRDYSILEMCKLFFDVDCIPDYINQNYGNCVNAKLVQDLLNSGNDITSICNITGYSRHQIHDAKATGKIHYPEFYKNYRTCPVEQYSIDWEYITTYKSISSAARAIGVNPKNISSQLNNNRSYCAGYNWKRKENVL